MFSIFLENIEEQKIPRKWEFFIYAGAERIELPQEVLETPVLPLYDAPII